MAVSKEFAAYVHEQLHLLRQVTSRRMFGGLGLYCDGLFFGIIAGDTLYCKVDASNREDYVQRGARPFMPFPGKPAMSYYEVPADVLEDAEELASWAKRSVAVALTTANSKARLPAKMQRVAAAGSSRSRTAVKPKARR
jgi:DNA transformation protein and related proteins